jgi:branched-chain amino acid transport system permease protein
LGASQMYLIAYALVFLAVMLVLPRGILPTLQDWLRRQRRRRASGVAGPTSAPATPQQPQPTSDTRASGVPRASLSLLRKEA